MIYEIEILEDFAMLLSIGMIVKNEERTLDTCLKSLDSLRKNVDCELIIADTGSTDSTKTIAAKYADILFDFAWCNDFAAARNSTIDRATGDWYMFLDADEIFEDTADIEEFFQSGEYLKYKNASFVIRSYLTLDYSTYSDFHACRIYKLTQTCRFSGRIHEVIPFTPPLKYLKSYVHHDGYLNIDPKKREAKKERNISMMLRELEENPNDVRLYSMLAQEYEVGSEENAKKELEYCNHGIQILYDNLYSPDKQINHMVNIHPSQLSIEYFYLYCLKANALVRLSKWNELIETSKRYFEGKQSDNLSDMTICFYLCNAYDHLEQWEDALNIGQHYVKLFDKMQQGCLNTDDAVTNGHILNSIDKYYSIIKDCLRFCINIEKYSSTFIYLKKLPAKEIDFFTILCGIEKNNDPIFAKGLYECLHNGDSSKKIEDFFLAAERFIFHSATDKKQLIHSLASIGQDDSIHYILLNKMRDCYLSENIEEAKKILSLLREVKPLHRLLSDVIYYSLKEKQDLSVLFESIRVDELVYYIQDIRSNHPDFPDVILEYFLLYALSYRNSVKALHWSVYLLEPAILILKDKKEQESNILILLNWYIEAIILYTHAIYHPDLLQDDRVTDLPAPARFAYYVEQAQCVDQSGDELGYYRNMTQAIDQYKVMAKPIKLLINHHREELENKKKQLLQNNQELTELAAQVKKQLYLFVEQKNYSVAKEVLASYDKIIPNDSDLSCIRELIQSEDYLSVSTVPS